MFSETLQSSTISTECDIAAQSCNAILRFTTAGSVDDGKSTLIGRLLYDSKALFEDQIASVRKSANRSTGPLDLALFTDGLRAEREQGITIDVAYRYFSTVKRKFIIADTPGHEQYTRNMVTGASNADAAVILIDASKGLLQQSRRHIYVSALLGIQHVVAAVNKMDLVDYQEDVFRRTIDDFEEFCGKLGIQNRYAIPVSALQGDNVVEPGARMKWFRGPTLLELLESLPVPCASESVEALRFPVQYVIRPDSTFRGFAGRVCTGALRRGSPVVALPSRLQTTIKSITVFDVSLDVAGPGSSVTVSLEDEIDLSRGDLLVNPASLPQVSSRFQANLVWLHSDQMRAGSFFLLKHTARTVRAKITAIRHRVDVNTLATLDTQVLRMNDIASVDIECAKPLHFDLYEEDRTLGSFILIDPVHKATVAAGMITANGNSSQTALRNQKVGLPERIARNGHPPIAVWLIDRSELAVALEREIFVRGWHGQTLSSDDFDPVQMKAAAMVSRNFGAITILSVSNERVGQREEIEALFGKEYFVELLPVPVAHSDALRALLQILDRFQGVPQ